MHRSKEKSLFPVDFAEQYQVSQVIEKEYENGMVEEFVGELPKKLVVRMEAIHVGRTKNYTFYTKEGLSDGLESWTRPYHKPVLTHHNQHDGEPIGRITSAQFHDVTSSGRPGLVFTAEITDKTAIPKVLDGRYATVSIGASTDRVSCNICGVDRTQEFCEHERGEEYDGLTCHFIIGKTLGREVSYVNVPADEFAGNVSVAIAESESPNDVLIVNENPIQTQGELIMENEQVKDESLLESVHDSVVADEIDVSKEAENDDVQLLDEHQKTKESETNPIVLEKTTDESLVKQLELQVELLNRNISTLQSEYVSLQKEMKRMIAERVVEMKRSLHKPDVLALSIEEAIEKYAEHRSIDSLKDTLEDLKQESKMPIRQQLSVDNPAVSIQEKEKRTTAKEAIDILNNMFKSKKGGF